MATCEFCGKGFEPDQNHHKHLCWESLASADQACETWKMYAESENRRRVYYQDIVYAVCLELDRAFAKRASRGEGTVCGTVDSPTKQVQKLMKELVDRDYARMLKLEELSPSQPQSPRPK